MLPAPRRTWVERNVQQTKSMIPNIKKNNSCFVRNPCFYHAHRVATCKSTNPEHQDHDNAHEEKLGPNVLASVKDLKSNVQWTRATVIRNEGVNLEGSIRTLHISVPDHVDVLYGRRVKGVVDSAKWIDSYTQPGQFVGLRFPSLPEPRPAKQLYAIASSPYASRRDSAYLDASLIEIVADRKGGLDDELLADLAPGAELEVTQVIGRGFSSLLNSYSGLHAIFEEKRSLLMIGVGTRGITPLRAALNWTPLLAHATAHPVTVLAVMESAAEAAFIPDWDQWRDAGINFIPVYTADVPSAEVDVMELIERKLFLTEHGFSGLVGGRAADCFALLAGVHGEMASGLARKLSAHGLRHEQMLFCDYF